MLSVHETSIRKLKIFCTVIESGGFSAAQLLLNTSASTISIQIKELESHLGLTLCKRGRSGFFVTEEGQAVYASAKKVLAAFGTFNLEVGAMRKKLSGEIRIGLQPNMATNEDFHLHRAVKAFQSRENDVHFRIEETRTAMLEARTLQGEYDLAIGMFAARVPGLDYNPILTEMVQLYCSADHPLATMPPAGIAVQLSEHPAASSGTALVSSMFHGHGMAMPTATTESMDAMLQLVLSGSYIGAMPTHFAKVWMDRGQIVPILPNQISAQIEFSMISKKRRSQNKVVDIFAKALIQAHR